MAYFISVFVYLHMHPHLLFNFKIFYCFNNSRDGAYGNFYIFTKSPAELIHVFYYVNRTEQAKTNKIGRFLNTFDVS